MIGVLVGCASTPQSPETRLRQENFAQVIPGKSTASDVRALLGAPERVLPPRGEKGEQWAYPYRGAGYRVFWVEISRDGVVRDASDSPDFDRDPRYRGG